MMGANKTMTTVIGALKGGAGDQGSSEKWWPDGEGVVKLHTLTHTGN